MAYVQKTESTQDFRWAAWGYLFTEKQLQEFLYAAMSIAEGHLREETDTKNPGISKFLRGYLKGVEQLGGDTIAPLISCN